MEHGACLFSSLSGDAPTASDDAQNSSVPVSHEGGKVEQKRSGCTSWAVSAENTTGDIACLRHVCCLRICSLICALSSDVLALESCVLLQGMLPLA
jgi:hypothetical protein